MITRLVLLGATGDMAGRFLLPALTTLRASGDLDADLTVVGAGHEDWDDDTFREHIAARLAEHAGDVPEPARRWLLDGLRYRRMDLDAPGGIAADIVAVATGPEAEPVAVYLALPAPVFAPTLEALSTAVLSPGSRVAVEKPFGDDLAGATALNALLDRVSGGDTDAVFRVDHILGMPAVHELERLRGPGGALEPWWDGEHLERVEVLWEETLGLGTRTDFFDRTGALRDVVQNHLLQALVLAAMEPPAGPSEHDLHAAKLALLRSLRAPSVDAMATRSRRARYTAGALVLPDDPAGRPVPGFAEERGVDPQRGTETYAEVLLEADSPRWAGTTFVLRNGKALGTERKGIALHFRTAVPDDVPHRLERVSDTELWLQLDGAQRDAPAGVHAPAVHAPGIQAPGVHAPGERSAYAAVMTDVLSGGSRTSVSAEEAEEAWRVLEPVLRAWSAGDVPLLEYPAGSAGPGYVDV